MDNKRNAIIKSSDERSTDTAWRGGLDEDANEQTYNTMRTKTRRAIEEDGNNVDAEEEYNGV